MTPSSTPASAASSASAAQREVVRRLEASGAGGLADLVLSTPVGGRGWIGDRPGAVPDRELLRVCLSVLARVCEQTPPAPPPERTGSWWSRLRAPRPEPVVVRVVPLDAMVFGHWQRIVGEGSGVRWLRLWEIVAARGSLPTEIDPRLDDSVAAVEVADALPAPLGTDAVGTDVLRRLNQLLGTRPLSVRRAPYVAPLRERFAAPAGRPLGVPAAAQDWAQRAAADLIGRIEASGLPVRGDLARVVPSTDGGARGVGVGAALDRAFGVLSGLERGDQSWRAR